MCRRCSALPRTVLPQRTACKCFAQCIRDSHLTNGFMKIFFCFPFASRHRSLPEVISSSPIPLREDVKRLKLIELQLQDDIKALGMQRDDLVMELQQLQEAKPMLMQAYTVRLNDTFYPIRFESETY